MNDSRYKNIFDIRKKGIYKIMSEVIDLFEPEDFQVMVENDLVFYKILKDNIPELLDELSERGKKKVGQEYIQRYLSNIDDIDYFIKNYTPDLIELYETEDGRQWIDDQITYLLENVWN